MSDSPKVQQIAQQLLDAFKAGTVAAALARAEERLRHRRRSPTGRPAAGAAGLCGHACGRS
jgi:hypothetical protein